MRPNRDIRSFYDTSMMDRASYEGQFVWAANGSSHRIKKRLDGSVANMLAYVTFLIRPIRRLLLSINDAFAVPKMCH